MMNTICNMSQFVIVVPIQDEISVTLSSYFMQRVLVKFGLYHLVVIDNNTHLKGSFIAMCQTLNLNSDILAKRNYKGLTVEYFHRFLNKSVTIAVEERGINDMFVPTIINVGCSWNSAHINGIYILRSLLTIGHKLFFSS